MYRLGIDVGSVSVNAAILNENDKIVKSQYIRHKGKPFVVARDVIEAALKEYEIEFIAATERRQGVRLAYRCAFYNEIVAVSRAMGHLYPETEAS